MVAVTVYQPATTLTQLSLPVFNPSRRRASAFVWRRLLAVCLWLIGWTAVPTCSEQVVDHVVAESARLEV